MGYVILGFAAVNYDGIRSVYYKVTGSETFSLNPPPDVDYDAISLGGSVVNTMSWLKKLGLKVAVIGAVGNDEKGDWLKKELKKRRIDFLPAKGIEGYTSVADIKVGINGERKIVIHPKGNDGVTWESIKEYEDIIRKTPVHISTFACAGDRYGSLETSIKIAEIAPSTSLRFGELYCEVQKKEPELIDRLLENTNIFSSNKAEVEEMTGKKYKEGVHDLIKNYDFLYVAITLGKEGCYVSDGTYDYVVEQEGVIEPVDTIGAGDSFIAGFLYGSKLGLDLEECGKLGNKIAAESVQKVGGT